MYDVSIVNNYAYSIFMNGGNQVIAGPNGGTATLTNWGTNYLSVFGMGDILFLDLGQTKISVYTNPSLPWTNYTWGGLVRYRGLDAYFRYEGQGKVSVTIDQFGSVKLSFPQGGMVVSLDDLTVG